MATDPAAAEEGSDPAVFGVMRIGPTNGSLTVTYEWGGTASPGDDYQALSGTVTIPAGAYRAPITVTPIDDFLIEGWESVVLALDQPAVWPPPYVVSWPSVAVAYIQDNDPANTNHPPVVALVNPPDGSVFVGVESIPLVARASDVDDRVVTVEFFDGSISLGVVRNPYWPPLTRTSADGDVVGGADSLILSEPPELLPDPGTDPNVMPSPIPVDLFRLVWQGPPPGRHILTAVATDTHGVSTRSDPVSIVVLEQTQPVVTVRATDPEATEPDPAGTRLDTATFTICRTGPTNFPLTVWYRLTGTASNGVDYRELPATVLIAEGARSAEVVVRPLGDNLVEGDESVILTIQPPICIAIFPPPPDCYLVGRPDAARAVIHDINAPPNRPPQVAIVRPLDGAVFLAPARIAIVAQAFDADGRVVQVEFFEGANSLGIVTNGPSSADNIRPPFSLIWSNVPPGGYVLTAVATDDDGATGRSLPIEIKVVPHTEPPVVNIVATDAVASEPGLLTVWDGAVFEVSRTGSTADPLVVFYAIGGTAANGLDYSLLPNRIMIPAGAAATNVVVNPLHDLLVEGTETVVLTLEPPPSGLDPNQPPHQWYVIGSNRVARAVILDNDLPPTNLPPRVAIVRPANGDVFVAPADIPICAAAFDPDGFVRFVEFFEGDRLLGVVSNNMTGIGGHYGNGSNTPEQSFHFLWNDVPEGSYVLTTKATDNRGASAVSEPIRIRVGLPPMPVVTIVARDAHASEGPLPILNPDGTYGPSNTDPPVPIVDTATFAVHRTGGTNEDLTVFYSLAGTAENSVDYARLSGQVTIPRGSWVAEIVVVPIDDRLPERTETVVATLEPVVCPAIFPPPPGCYLVGDPGRATAYVRDNDFNLSPKVEIVKPADQAVFVAPADIEIGVVALDPDGWVGKVEFYADNRLIDTQEIMFIIPPPPGQPQTFSTIWSNAPLGQHVLMVKAYDDGGAVSSSDPVHILVVGVHPIPVVTIVATDPVATEPDPRSATPVVDVALFQVTRRGGDLAKPLTVFYRVSGTASNGSDYVELSGRVEIPAGEASAPIYITPLGDELVEGTENVVVALEQLRCVTTDPPPPPGCYIVGTPGRDIAYIRDRDWMPNRPPKVALLHPANGTVFMAPADIHLVAGAEDSDGWVSTVEFFEGDRSLGIVTNRPWIVEPVRLPNLNGAVLSGLDPISIPIPPPFGLWWSNVPPGQYVLTAVATDNEGATARSAPVEISVREGNLPPVVTIMAIDSIAREGTTNTAVFRVRRVGPTNEPLTVMYAIGGTARNGEDYERLTGLVTIPAARRAARIVVRALDDQLLERMETVILRLQPSPLDVFPPPYVIGRPATASAVILDNDCPRPVTQTLPDGNLHLRLPVPTGLPCRLEGSSDLRNWEPVLSNYIVTDDGLDFVEGEKLLLLHRFYRVVPEVEFEAEEE